MHSFKIGDIIEVKVTGIEAYGIFVKVDESYSGLIHISEIDNSYIKDVSEYVKIGEIIHANIIGIDEETNHLSLSIKNMNYNNNNNDTRKIKENVSGFLPLYNKLNAWITETIEEIKNEQN